MKTKILVFVLIVSAAFAGNALATPVTPPGSITAETARGVPADDIKLKSHYENGGSVKLQTNGPIEVITQRIVAQPGASFGWHSHPGENVNVVLQGTLRLFHDETCTAWTEYGPGSSFTTSPEDIHLAHSTGSVELILFATYFAPLTTPLQAVRIDQPSPGLGCPL